MASPAELAALELHTNAIRALAGKGANAAWEIGSHYNAIADGRLTRRAGYVEVREYLEKNVSGISGSVVQMFGSVQRRFSQAEIESFGPTKLYRLMTYLRYVDWPRGKSLDDLEIAVLNYRGELEKRKFPACSERDINKAIRREQLAWRVRRYGESPVHAIARELQKSCRELFGLELRFRNKEPVLHLPLLNAAELVEVARAILRAAEPAKEN